MIHSAYKPDQGKTKKYVSLYLFLVCLILLTLPACGGGGGGDGDVVSDVGTHKIPMEAVGLEKKWVSPTENKIYSSPALAQDGTIYIGSDDGHLYALDPDNGEEIWKFPAQGGLFFPSPAIGDDGIIYLGSHDDNLYAIYPDGTQKWSFLTEDIILATPALDHNGIIYVGSNDGKLYAITPEGEKKWSSVNLGGWVSSPAIGEDNTIYVGAGEINWSSPAQSIGRFYALEPENGDIKWQTEFNVSSRPAIGSNGTIYAGSTNKNFYALDPNGEEIWKYTTGGPILSCPKILEGETDIIIIGSDDKKLYAFNSDGEIIWSAQLTDEIRSSAEIGPDDTIYIGCHDNCLHAFDAEDGAHIAYFPTGKSVTSIPAVSNDGTIYFGSQDSNIYALIRSPVKN